MSGRIAAPVEEQERLLAARDRALDPGDRPRRQPAAARRPLALQVHGRDVGQGRRAEPAREPQPAIAAGLGVDPRLDRGRGGSEHDRRLFEPRAHDAPCRGRCRRRRPPACRRPRAPRRRRSGRDRRTAGTTPTAPRPPPAPRRSRPRSRSAPAGARSGPSAIPPAARRTGPRTGRGTGRSARFPAGARAPAGPAAAPRRSPRNRPRSCPSR